MVQRDTAYVSIFENLKILEEEVQLTKVCQSAGLTRRVSVGMHYRTIHDVNDGFEGSTGTCREHA